jgi:hypothetical protein
MRTFLAFAADLGNFEVKQQSQNTVEIIIIIILSSAGYPVLLEQ